MSEQAIHNLQFMGAIVPATALVGLLIYFRCAYAGYSPRATAVTVAGVCGAVLVSAATMLLARDMIGGGLFDMGLRADETGISGVQTTDLRHRSWGPAEIAVFATATAITIAMWVVAMRCIRAIPLPAPSCDGDAEAGDDEQLEPARENIDGAGGDGVSAS